MGDQISNEMFVDIQVVHGKTEAPIWKHLSKVDGHDPRHYTASTMIVVLRYLGICADGEAALPDES
jgi:hypothetical protein